MNNSNDVPTMICGTRLDDREQWAPISDAFKAAMSAYGAQGQGGCRPQARQTVWSQAESNLRAAGLAVARFISGTPAIIDEKRVMASRLSDQSLERDATWLEGLADLIDASNGELPARFRPKGENLYPNPKVMPSWPLARKFWQHTAEGSPAMGVSARTVLRTSPTTCEELGEKVMIAAFVGGLKLVVGTLQAGPTADTGAAEVKKWMFRLMEVTNTTCLAAIMDPRRTEKIMEAAQRNPFGIDFTPAELVRVMLHAADTVWHRAIWSDAMQLGLKSGRRPSAMILRRR
jgi:hypothetical protein